MKITRYGALLLGASLALAVPARSQDLNLPALGDRASSVVSPQQEAELGQAWLRQYRRQVPDYDDPLLEQYLEQLIGQLAIYSRLPNSKLQVVLVSNPEINAFAVPGGVIGIHSGLLLTARSEDELASVLAHELAHLSQRHWIRSLEASRENNLPTLAGVLAGLVLIATNNGDAGMAALTTTQAANLDAYLRFSRKNEQEADQIGLQTLYAAGFNPEAMTVLFERLMDATRLQGRRPPEYLLTHPVTERRIADSRARLLEFPLKHFPDHWRYHLMRARVQLHHAESPQYAVKRFQAELDGSTNSTVASQYGLALAWIQTGQFTEAEATLSQLRRDYPEESAFALAWAELELARNRNAEAVALLQQWYDRNPDDFAVAMALGVADNRAQDYRAAERVYRRLSEQRPDDLHIWYALAEVRGLSGDTAGVHLARAEYFMLTGVYDKARAQLQYAQQLLKDNYVESERIKQKLQQIDTLEKATLDI